MQPCMHGLTMGKNHIVEILKSVLMKILKHAIATCLLRHKVS